MAIKQKMIFGKNPNAEPEPLNGQLFYNVDNGKIYEWKDGRWVCDEPAPLPKDAIGEVAGVVVTEAKPIISETPATPTKKTSTRKSKKETK